MQRVELGISHKVSAVLAVDLKGEGPKVSFPDRTCFCVLKSQEVFVVNTLASRREVRARDIVPECHNTSTSDNRPQLEPTL